jgi:N-acetylmuramoyl-L-alanine amidase
MAFQLKYEITRRYLTKPSKRRGGALMSPGVRFIVAHDTGNPSSTAAANVKYYERSRNEMSASAHIFVDDKEIVECIPALEAATSEKAWHVVYSTPTDNQLFGFDANDAAIGIEYCFGGRIDADEAYRKYVWVIAYACHIYGLDPRRKVVGHFFLDPQRKTDPVSGLAHSRRGYEQLLRDVVTEHDLCAGVVPPAPADFGVTARAGTATAMARLNVRKGMPSTRAPVHQVIPRGANLAFSGSTEAGESINGNSTWYADGNGNFFWSGAVKPFN